MLIFRHLNLSREAMVVDVYIQGGLEKTEKSIPLQCD